MAQTTFCFESDYVGKRRVKTTHTQGVIAQVEFVPTEDHPYTGMWAEH